MKRWRQWLGLTPAAVLVGGCILAPLVLVVRVSLYEPAPGAGFYTPGTWTVQNYGLLLQSSGLNLLGFTLAFGVAVAVGVVAIAFPLALFVRRLSGRGRALALACVLLTKTAGLLAGLFGLQRLLPRGLAASVLAEIYLILPYALLTLFVHALSLKPELEQAARGLGARPAVVFRRVTLPLCAPGLLVAFQLSLMWGVGALLGPLFLGGPEEMTLSVEIHRQAFEYGRWPRAAVLSGGLLLLTGAALAIVSAAFLRAGRNAT